MFSTFLFFILSDTLLQGIREYETFIPQTVDHRGRFLSFHVHGERHETSNTARAKRDTRGQRDIITGLSEYRIFYRFLVFGKEFHFDLTLNTDFIAPEFYTEVQGKDGIVTQSKDVSNCYYIGQSREPFISTAAISNCYGLVIYCYACI